MCDDAGRAAGDRQELHGTGGKDYGAAIERYHVSYPQVYSWVRKYDEQGIAGLNDRRGKRKPLEEMTEVEARLFSLATAIGCYIHFYNYERRQRKLGRLAPMTCP